MKFTEICTKQSEFSNPMGAMDCTGRGCCDTSECLYYSPDDWTEGCDHMFAMSNMIVACLVILADIVFRGLAECGGVQGRGWWVEVSETRKQGWNNIE